MADRDNSSSSPRALSSRSVPSKSVAHAKVALHLQRLVATAVTSAAILNLPTHSNVIGD
jgi:hypothetical protein